MRLSLSDHVGASVTANFSDDDFYCYFGTRSYCSDFVSPAISNLNKPCWFLLLAAQPRMNQGISVGLSTVVSLHALYSVAFISRRCSRWKSDQGVTCPEYPAPFSRIGPYLLIDYCFIFVLFGHYDEPETLLYENLKMYPKDANASPLSK